MFIVLTEYDLCRVRFDIEFPMNWTGQGWALAWERRIRGFEAWIVNASLFVPRREIVPMNDAYHRLSSNPGGFTETDYLAFLARRVPQDLGEQLTRDAHPELMLDEYVETVDLMRPLSSHSFPADCDSRVVAVFRLAGILEYTLSRYILDIEKGAHHADPYKQVYIASFYLYCCLRGAIRGREYVGALLVLVKAAGQVELEGQLQVSRFLGSLIPLIPGADVADPAPLSSILIALSLIGATIVSDLSVRAERAMCEEGFVQAWTREQEEFEEGYPCLDAMKALRQVVSDFFGASGKVEQIAFRFREAGAKGAR